MADPASPSDSEHVTEAPPLDSQEMIAELYSELRRLAARMMRSETSGTLQPTALIHEGLSQAMPAGGRALGRQESLPGRGMPEHAPHPGGSRAATFGAEARPPDAVDHAGFDPRARVPGSPDRGRDCGGRTPRQACDVGQPPGKIRGVALFRRSHHRGGGGGPRDLL